MFESVVEKLLAAKTVVLSTHRRCDGDGLGSEIAMFHALRQLGCAVRVLNVDQPPSRYSFLQTESCVEVFTNDTTIAPTDLALIFDTNDSRLIEPLFSKLKSLCKQILFIDHHAILTHGPSPTKGSLIDTGAASTGELVFRLLKTLNVELNAEIARSLYTSVVFDTQLFRYVKSLPQSHEMAAELLKYERNPEEVHRKLFSTYTVEGMGHLASALAKVEYFSGGRLAFLPIQSDELAAFGLDQDEALDVVDMVMNIESVELAVLVREEAPNKFKVSLRSKGQQPVLSFAETLGGGGHQFAAGAYVSIGFAELRDKVLQFANDSLNGVSLERAD